MHRTAGKGGLVRYLRGSTVVMRTVVAQLSTLSFVFLCVASSAIGIICFPTSIAVTFDALGLSTEAPLSNFVGSSLVIAAAVGFILPTTALMTARGEFDPPPR
jgi:hypothetical protein